MFAKFKITSDEVNKLQNRIGNILLLDQVKTEESFYKDILKIALGQDGVLDGTELQKMNFPSLLPNYHFFISYSHKDEEVALYLASYLKNKCGLNCFLDSTVWHSADGLLKQIDNKYCVNLDGQTYSYKKRNFSTSHVHAMLSMAMLEVIDRSDCCIVLDSDNSFNLEEGIKRYTYSPWLYEEISFMNNIQIKKPLWLNRLLERRMYSEGGQVICGSEDLQLKVKYHANLESFYHLTEQDLYQLKGEEVSGLMKLFVGKHILTLKS